MLKWHLYLFRIFKNQGKIQTFGTLASILASFTSEWRDHFQMKCLFAYTAAFDDRYAHFSDLRR